MSLGQQIKQKILDCKTDEGKDMLQWVADQMSARGRKAGLSAKNKNRGDSEYYSKLSKKRWN